MIRLLMLALLPLIAHASYAAEEDVQTTLRILQFNNVAEQYLDRQTVVTVRGKPGKQELMIRFAPYGASSVDLKESWFLFREKYADDYLAHISKYLKWAKQAAENGDVFTKDIGKSKSVVGIKLEFKFHSGNASTHYLVIEFCSLGNCSVKKPIYLDQNGAAELFSLITKLKAGELPGEDVGANYN